MRTLRLVPLLVLFLLLYGQPLLSSGQAYAQCCTCNPTCMKTSRCTCCTCGMNATAKTFDAQTGKGTLQIRGIPEVFSFNIDSNAPGRDKLKPGFRGKFALKPVPVDFSKGLEQGLKSLEFQCSGIDQKGYADRTAEFQFTYNLTKSILEHAPTHEPENEEDRKAVKEMK